MPPGKEDMYPKLWNPKIIEEEKKARSSAAFKQ